jgi:hypothetical protein
MAFDYSIKRLFKPWLLFDYPSATSTVMALPTISWKQVGIIQFFSSFLNRLGAHSQKLSNCSDSADADLVLSRSLLFRQT